jgi:glycosyltransferase involved in cell wall biosynthesis
LRGELENKCIELGLAGAVQFVGAQVQDEVLRWWRCASIAVLSSDTEGMPVSLMEAAACGVPAVAPAVGGIPELIEDGVSGLLAPPNDPLGLATAMERLLAQPGLAARLGSAARQRAETHFSVKRQADQLLGVWSEVLEARHG